MKILFLLSFAALTFANPIHQNPEGQTHRTMNFDRYWTYDEIASYMRQMEASYPSISRVEQMGRTEEGRDILGIRIGDPERLADGSLPVVLITAAANARDWITAMSAVNLMHMLLDQYAIYREIVDNLEWFIIPVANPDGYVFSMTSGVSLNDPLVVSSKL